MIKGMNVYLIMIEMIRQVSDEPGCVKRCKGVEREKGVVKCQGVEWGRIELLTRQRKVLT